MVRRSAGAMIAGTSLAILAIAAVVLAAQGALAFIEQGKPPPAPAPISTKIRTGQLDDSVTAEVTVFSSFSWTVQATGVLTRPGAPVGTPVSAGSVLATVNERPIILMTGTIPMYRDLGPGSIGTDVTQLQHTLASLGHYRGRVDGVYSATTAQAVYRLYRALGYPAVGAGGTVLATTNEADQASLPQVEATFAPEGRATPRTTCGTIAQRTSGDLCTLDAGTTGLVAIPPDAERTRVTTGQRVSITFGTQAATGTLASPSIPEVQPENETPPDGSTSPPTESEGSKTTGPSQKTGFEITLDSPLDAVLGTTGTAVITIAASEPNSLLVDAIALRTAPDGSTQLHTRARPTRRDVTVGLCIRGSCVVTGDNITPGLDVLIPLPAEPTRK